MDDIRQKLEELWQEIFEHAQLDLTPEEFVRCGHMWREQRPTHLPLTLKVMLQGVAPLEYWRGESATGERALLLMAGYSEEQLALSIAAHVQHGCTQIVPFSSPAVWTYIQEEVVACLHDLGLRLKRDYWLAPLQQIEPNDPADVFRKIMHWVRANPDKCPAVDCTGGKKPMDAGSVYAASFYSLPAYYVDFDDYERVLRRPLPWTCRYHSLSLPDTVFSLAMRHGVLKLFEARRFAEARALLTQILDAPQARQYLEESDWLDLTQALQFVHQCDCWMQLRYDDASLKDHKLYPYFVVARDNKAKPREMIETLLQRDHLDLLREYVVDEYWRLWTLRDMAALREALIGCVGLVELIIDALFFFPWFDDVRIDTVIPRRWKNDKQELPTQDTLGWHGQPIDPSCLPLANYYAKVIMLRTGKMQFEVRAGRNKTGSAELTLPRPKYKDPPLETIVTLQTASPPLQFAEKRLWKQHWGDYPNNSWVQARHALVHMRTPAFLDADLEAGLKDAMEQVLPRFIELLFWLPAEGRVDITASADPAWVTWRQHAAWNRDHRLPWAGQETVMAAWLRLPSGHALQ